MSNVTKLVRSVIICDDVRREITGKDIAVGIYNGLILFHEFPAHLTSFGLRIEFVPLKADYDTIRVMVQKPNGEPLIISNGSLAQIEPNLPVALTSVHAPVYFEHPGIYRIFLDLEGESAEVGFFHVQKWGDHSYKPAFSA